MNLEVHSLIWPQSDMRLLDANRRVTEHFGLEVKYHVKKVEHGEWMDDLMLSSKADVVGFLDIDCIPLDAAIVPESARWAAENRSFVGIAQASNRLGAMNHIYAGPAFLFISRACYSQLRVSFLETKRSDVAEEFTYLAEKRGLRFRGLFPTRFEREPREGAWHLGSYGLFGIGTVYEDRVYHLYQGRFKENRDLFVKRCDEVVSDTFDTSGMHDSRNFEFTGRIAPPANPPSVTWSLPSLRAELRNRIMRLRPRLAPRTY